VDVIFLVELVSFRGKLVKRYQSTSLMCSPFNSDTLHPNLTPQPNLRNSDLIDKFARLCPEQCPLWAQSARAQVPQFDVAMQLACELKKGGQLNPRSRGWYFHDPVEVSANSTWPGAELVVSVETQACSHMHGV